ncbi:unnamed protein product [Oikopleura dioica]|uniref:Uncharacterized protein n=1 Tax=Oikopleura dioica TaxID=34765 RepID=E4XUK8_OIKDI|nr:unnamed protein product [Oikopleura dioica]
MADANLQAEKNGSGELMTVPAGSNSVERRPADFVDGEEDDEEDDDDLKSEEKESTHKIEEIKRKQLASDSDGEEMDDFDAAKKRILVTRMARTSSTSKVKCASALRAAFTPVNRLLSI